MGMMRKLTSVSTMGAVNYNSNKEKARKNEKKANQIAARELEEARKARSTDERLMRDRAQLERAEFIAQHGKTPEQVERGASVQTGSGKPKGSSRKTPASASRKSAAPVPSTSSGNHVSATPVEETPIVDDWATPPSVVVFEPIDGDVTAAESAMPAPADDQAHMDIIAQLERLGKLKDNGILTEAEFAAQKEKLLARL